MILLILIAQFGLAALIVLTSIWPPRVEVWFGLPGTLLAVWAWFVMGLRKIRVHPKPSQAAELTTSGPYAWIRHPMYSGVLLATLPLACVGLLWWKMAAWLLLVAVLVIKIQIEEKLLQVQFESYKDYAGMTWRLIPFVW